MLWFYYVSNFEFLGYKMFSEPSRHIIVFFKLEPIKFREFFMIKKVIEKVIKRMILSFLKYTFFDY